jgi:hypothetical protein
MAFVCFALMCIYLNINFENLSLWETAGYYPYHKNDITHINGLLDNYNMLSYIMLSGFIFSIFKCCINRPYFFFSSLLLFSIILFFFIKAKIVFLVFLVSIVFFIFFHYKNKSFSKYYLFFSLILIIIFYSLVTNFIILEKNFTNHTEVIQNLKYYTKVPLFSLGNYDIYGSLFYKLKVVAFEQAKSFNFFVFQSLDYNSFLEFFSNTKGNDFKIISNFEPHSLYFSFLGEYGLLGLLIIMIFFSYPFYLILTHKNLSIDAIAALTILIIYYIEAVNTDIINFRFLWIVLAFLHVESCPKNLIMHPK